MAAGHAGEEQRRRFGNLDHRETRLELLDAVAHEARPVFGPGMSDFSALIIWQPLQTPSAKVSGRPKKAENCSRARALNRMVGPAWPAPSTSP